MTASKADIIARLRKDILPFEGFKTVVKVTGLDRLFGSIKNAFPNKCFPIGAMHEFIVDEMEAAAVTQGFICAALAALMHDKGAVIWIGANRCIFPPALKAFGIAPDRIIFIQLKKEKDILWAMEEALKCEGLSAVLGEMKALDFTASRRLQLAVEQSRVTGFILRQQPRSINTTACITRWKISSIASELRDGMPGVGFPRWNVELLKVRNGKPGSWQVEFIAGRFRHIYQPIIIPQLQKKTG